MLKVGAKVYVWNFYDKRISKSVCAPHEEVIGEVIKYEEGSNCVHVKSILDGKTYIPRVSYVFEVGTGPAVCKNETIYEDYYV